jgi:NADPH:quinone reductase-like Zn-dependent oxidoreductase
MLRFLADLFDRGELMMPEIATMPLEEAQAAHRQSESGTTRGKLVLMIG